MRTTLDLADDLLQTAKELARLRGTTAGEVVSDLARKGLQFEAAESSATTRSKVRNGVPLLPRQPAGAPKLTLDLVNRFRDDA